MKQWNVFVKGELHEVVFEGSKLSGKGKFNIDGKKVAVPAVLVEKIGLFYPLEIDGSEVIAKCDLKNQPAAIVQDGVYLDTGAPLEESVQSALRLPQDPLAAKERSGMGSFLTFTLLTYVNLFLLLIDSSVSFPFSAMVPQVVFGIFLYSETPSTPGIIVGALIAVALTSVYLLLYLLSRKNRLWPVVTALIFAVIDSLILLYFSLDDLSSSLIDLAFHAWVLWSLIQLFLVRRKKMRQKLLETD